MKKLSNDQLAFFLARVTIGINFLIHGLVRIPKLSKFAEGLSKGFEETYLPEIMVMPFAYALPFIELLLGVLLTIGFKTRYATIVGSLLIAVLIFGSGIKEDWAAVGTQMVYAIFFFLLIKNLAFNACAIDNRNKD